MLSERSFSFFIVLAAAVVSSTAFSADSFVSCQSPKDETAVQAQVRLSQQVLLAGLKYAREHSHPVTGFVEDTIGNYSDFAPKARVRASISSTGFLMALVADLYIKRMVSRDEAFSYCEKPLAAVLKKKADDLAAAERRKMTGEADPHLDLTFQGWFSHFIDWSTGDRWMDENTHKGVEYATTDSTWFLSGAIVCAETFPNSEISEHTEEIFADVNFNAFRTDGGTNNSKLTMSMGYTPTDVGFIQDNTLDKTGYSKAQWQIYQHSWLVYLLGLAAPRDEYRLPLASWAAWGRTGRQIIMADSDLNGQILYGDKRALFSHYFPDVFMPPQEIKEACNIDYFKNSQFATLFNKEMSKRDTTSKTFQSGLWGLDAGPNPNIRKLKLGAALSVGGFDTVQYGVNTPYKRNGTACPACAVAAAMFEPEMVFHDLRAWCDDANIGAKIWGNYGPANGVNLDYGWISPCSLSGIVGPMALSVANIDSKTSVWALFLKNKYAQAGLKAVAAAPLPPMGCLNPE